MTGSYDRTVRIYRHREGRSREVYHTKRMQRVFCVNYSGDGRFVLSGSDDTNLRIWKAQVRGGRQHVAGRFRTCFKFVCPQLGVALNLDVFLCPPGVPSAGVQGAA